MIINPPVPATAMFPQLSASSPRRIASRMAVGLLVLLLGLALVVTLGALGGTAFGVSAPAINQCNGVDNVGGQAISCTVTVTNNLNLATGDASTSVTGTSCSGAANAGLTCIPWSAPSNQLTSSVTQCNGSGSGGGGTVTCSVHVVNNITGNTTTSPVTVNQCNAAAEGGGTQPTLVCNPLGSTTNATVTQCNQSGNGGGGTQRVQCSVTTSTQSSAIPFSVNQCVGSGNGGGSTVTCTVAITTNILTSGGPTSGTPTTIAPVGPPAGGGTTGTGPTGSSPTGSGPTGSGSGPTGSGPRGSGPTGSGPAGPVPGAAFPPTGPGPGTNLGAGPRPPTRLVKSILGTVGTHPTAPVAPTGRLAFTGADISTLVLGGLILLVLGSAVLATSKRGRAVRPS